MEIIVENRETGKRLLFLGSGYGHSHAMRPSMLMGKWFPIDEKQSYSLICLSDAAGNIVWGYSKDFIVVEVNGKPVSELKIDQIDLMQQVNEAQGAQIDQNVICPDCGEVHELPKNACHKCGKVLIELWKAKSEEKRTSEDEGPIGYKHI